MCVRAGVFVYARGYVCHACVAAFVSSFVLGRTDGKDISIKPNVKRKQLTNVTTLHQLAIG